MREEKPSTEQASGGASTWDELLLTEGKVEGSLPATSWEPQGALWEGQEDWGPGWDLGPLEGCRGMKEWPGVTSGGDGGERGVRLGTGLGLWGWEWVGLSSCPDAPFPPWLAFLATALRSCCWRRPVTVPCSSSSYGSSVLQQDLDVPCLPCRREPPQPWIVHVLLVGPPRPETSGGHTDFPLSVLCLDLAVLQAVLPRLLLD